MCLPSGVVGGEAMALFAGRVMSVKLARYENGKRSLQIYDDCLEPQESLCGLRLLQRKRGYQNVAVESPRIASKGRQSSMTVPFHASHYAPTY
jgi:hypothetical protein